MKLYVVTEDVNGERATLVYTARASALKHVYMFSRTYGGTADQIVEEDTVATWRYGDVSVDAQEVEVRP